MPSIREVSPDEVPVKLEKVEVRPGVILKLSPADKAALAKQQAEQEAAIAAFRAGQPAPKAAAPEPAVVVDESSSEPVPLEKVELASGGVVKVNASDRQALDSAGAIASQPPQPATSKSRGSKSRSRRSAKKA